VTNIRTKAANDDDSRLGVYMKVNPELLAPPQYGDRLEIDRISCTRYRCGSHNLKVETGRLQCPVIPRENQFF